MRNHKTTNPKDEKKINRKEALKKAGQLAALTAATTMFLMDAHAERGEVRGSDKKPPKDSPKPPRP